MEIDDFLQDDIGGLNDKDLIAAVEKQRIDSAREAITEGGGPTELARKLSEYLGYGFSVNRIRKWRYTGIPVRWGVLIEHITGYNRAKLNPMEYIRADTKAFDRIYKHHQQQVNE